MIRFYTHKKHKKNTRHQKAPKAPKSTKSAKTQISEKVTFFPLHDFYAHKNTAFFVFVCLYAFLCLIKLIMTLRVLTFTDKT